MAFLRANTSDFTAKMGAAKAEVDDLSKGGASNFEKLATVGKAALLGVAAGAAVVIGASVDLAEKFQGTVTSIAASGDISVGTAQKIGDAFLGTAGATIYSGQQIGTAFAAVAGQVKLLNGGVLNAKAALDVMRPSMDLAEASGTSLSSATSDIASTLQAFGLQITSSPLVSNVLFNAARQTGTSVDSLSSALDKARAKMGTAAPSVQQLGGLLVDLTQHGETGRAAMTSLGSAFTGIIKPTKDVFEAQLAAGVSFINTKGALDPLSQILGEVAPKIANMGNAQAAAYLQTLGFGSASAKLVDTIKAGPAVLDRYTASVSKSGSAHAAAEKQSQTLSHQLETLKAQFEDYATILGEKLIPILERVAASVAKLVDWFTKHKDVAIALALVIGGVLVVAIGAAIAAFVAANAATLGIGLAIGALIAGVVYLATHWQQVWTNIKNWFDDAVKFLRSGFGTLVLLVAGPLLPLIELGLHWQAVWSLMKTAASDFVGFFTAIPGEISAGFDTIVSFVAGIPGRIVGALSSLGGLLLGWIQDAWGTFKTWIEAAWGLEVTFWIGIPTKIIAGLASFGGLLLGWIQTAWNTFKGWIESAWNTEVSFWSSIPSRVISALSALGGDLLTLGGSIMGSFASGVTAAWGAISGWFANLPGNIITAIGNIADLLYNIGKAIINSLKRGLEDAFNDVKNFVGGIANTISNLKGPISYDATLLIPHGNAIMQSLATGLQQGFTSKVAPLVNGIAGQIAGTNFGGGSTPGIASLPGAGGSSVPGGGGGTTPLTATVILQIDGETFLTAIQPAAAQWQRTSSQPFFGAVR